MSRWTEFKPRRFQGKAKLDGVVSVFKNGFLLAENLAQRGLKGVQYVRLLVDGEGYVGVQPSREGYKISYLRDSGAARISCSSFMKFHRFARGYYPAEWDDDVLVFKPDVEKEVEA